MPSSVTTTVLGEYCGPDAGTDMQRVFLDEQRLTHGGDDLARDLQSLETAGNIRQNHGKLIAAEAGDRVRAAQAETKALGHDD